MLHPCGENAEMRSLVRTHPTDKNKNVARMGHPFWWPAEAAATVIKVVTIVPK